jgi:hypothetical protein
MILAEALGILGRDERRGWGARIIGRNEKCRTLEEKFDSGWLSLHVLSIP